MASIISVDDIIEKTSGHGVQIPGHVVQVVYGTSVADNNSTSTSFVASDLSASITPSSTSSKILVQLGLASWHVASANAYVTVYRDSTNIGNGTYGISMLYATSSGTYIPAGAIQVLDSPSSTSSLTYKMYFRSHGGGSTYVSYSTYGIATITLMEIAQ